MNRSIVLALACASLWMSSGAALAGPVNINKADAQTLAAELNGIGMALAQAIVDDRMANGEFDSPQALLRVKGIGQHVLDVNKGDILVDDPSAKS